MIHVYMLNFGICYKRRPFFILFPTVVVFGTWMHSVPVLKVVRVAHQEGWNLAQTLQARDTNSWRLDR